ncbi:MAG TPA: IS3 family transposase, partial [Acidimicrobiales bacterium]|nr:IS3 family transposase [Acidimicrobiales bacterium]
MKKELHDRWGICASKKRVARLMAALGLAGRCKRRSKRTTIADPDAETKAADLVRRAFGPGVRELDSAWCGDISYVRT